MDFTRIEIRVVCSAVPDAVQLSGPAFMELAHASSLRLALDHFLASGGRLDSEQDPLRRVPWATRATHVLATAHDGALGTDDARRAREVSSRLPWRLRPVSSADCGNKGVVWGWTTKDKLCIFRVAFVACSLYIRL